MKTYLCHDAAEAQGLREDRISLLVIRIKPPIPEGSTFEHLTGRMWAGNAIEHVWEQTRTNCGYVDQLVHRNAPYAPGDAIGIKEQHRYKTRDVAGLHVEYRDGEVLACDIPRLAGEHEHLNPYRNGQKVWRTANQMTRQVIRTRVLCRSVEARMVLSADWIDAKAAGCGFHEGSRDKQTSPEQERVEEFRFMWESRHPNLPFESAWAWIVNVEVLDGR